MYACFFSGRWACRLDGPSTETHKDHHGTRDCPHRRRQDFAAQPPGDGRASTQQLGDCRTPLRRSTGALAASSSSFARSLVLKKRNNLKQSCSFVHSSSRPRAKPPSLSFSAPPSRAAAPAQAEAHPGCTPARATHTPSKWLTDPTSTSHRMQYFLQ